MTERERLIELLAECYEIKFEKTEYSIGSGPDFEKIADNLLTNGVIVPPCKVGQTVYDYSGRECIVVSMHFYNDGLPVFTTTRTGYHGAKINQSFVFEDVGKAVFFTSGDMENSVEGREKS